MRKAWIENDIVRDIAPGDPVGLYTSDIAAHYDTEVPDDAENGDTFKAGVLTKRPIPEPAPAPEPVAPEPPKLSPVQFKVCFTAQERIAIKALRATNPVIDDAYEILDDPRLTTVDLSLESNQNMLLYLVSLGLLTAERAAEIKTGKML